jgi:acyl-CoA oxidase
MSDLMPQLQAFLDGDQAEVRERTRRLLARPELAPPPVDIGTDAHRERVLEQARFLAGQDRAVTLGFPVDLGGGGDVAGFVTAFETLAHGDLSLLVKVGVQFGLFGGSIQQLGTRRHHERYLPPAMTLELPGCFAMTESAHGSDVQSLETTAEYDPDTEEFVITTPRPEARKDYIGNAAAHGRVATVFAQLHTGGEDRGVHAFVVPIRDDAGEPLPGIAIEDCGPKIGLNGVDNGRLGFDRVRVPREALLDRFASVDPDGGYHSPIESQSRRFFTMLGTLVQGRVSISGAAVAASKNALTTAVRYALGRRQFPRPDGSGDVLIMDYLTHQRRLLPRIATTYALSCAQQLLVDDLAHVIDGDDVDDRDRRKLETRAAGLKAIATWHATDTAQACREACGGVGYLSENRLGVLKADTEIFTTFEGDNTVLMQLVAKGLLTSYREEFFDLDWLGTASYVAEQFAGAVIERTAARQLIQTLVDAVPGRDEDADLLDRGWHVDLVEYREEHVLDGLARRLKRGADAGHDAFDVFNRCQDHVVLAARAFLDRVVLEAFVARIDTVTDPAAREVLERLCDLHVLSLLERERGWYLEHGRLTGARSKAIIDAVDEACRDLRPHVGDLVEAFAVPEQALGAPIAPAPTTSG